MSDQDWDLAIKQFRVKKLQIQGKLLEKQLSGIITQDEHLAAMECQRKELLLSFGQQLAALPEILCKMRIIPQGKKEAVRNVIGEWLRQLAKRE